MILHKIKNHYNKNILKNLDFTQVWCEHDNEHTM
jgi:hypothetical protein